MAMMGWVAWFAYAAINIAAFAAFQHDKRQAIAHRSRISENDLLALAWFGGALGALLAQQIFRHKTRKQPFRALLIAAGVWNAIAGALIASPELRASLMRLVFG